MAVEREIRLLVPLDVVDLTGAANRVDIHDVYFVRSERVNVRLRVLSEAAEQVLSTLDFKFWRADGTTEERVPLGTGAGAALIAAAKEANLRSIAKTRHTFPYEGSVRWEIDIYASPLDFFVIAECEYVSNDLRPNLQRPPNWYRGAHWGSESLEITNDIDFFDVMLSRPTAEEFRRYVAARLDRRIPAGPIANQP